MFPMPSRSVLSSTHPVVSVQRMADAICRELTTTLTTLARRRYGADVTIHCPDRAAAPEAVRCRLTWNGDSTCPEPVQMGTELRVTHIGGNMYDVHCAVEEGASRRFTYSLPQHRVSSFLRASGLGPAIGDFLLNELERTVGRHQLRH